MDPNLQRTLQDQILLHTVDVLPVNATRYSIPLHLSEFLSVRLSCLCSNFSKPRHRNPIFGTQVHLQNIWAKFIYQGCRVILDTLRCTVVLLSTVMSIQGRSRYTSFLEKCDKITISYDEVTKSSVVITANAAKLLHQMKFECVRQFAHYRDKVTESKVIQAQLNIHTVGGSPLT